MFNLCIHKWGKIENEYQYCTKCGKASKIKCSHKWEQLAKYSVYDSWQKISLGVIYVDICSKCGERKKFKVNA